MLGKIALALALPSGLTAMVAYWLWARGRTDMRGVARLFTIVMTVSVIIAAAFQLRNILTHQFQYVYVTNFSDRSLPPLLLFSTFWGGQSGSLLLWSLWSVLLGGILMLALRHGPWEPFVLAPYMLITVCIVALTAASSPFQLLDERPLDGQGLNPLLQNYWMAIHPPILFTGFTTMAVPFALAVAALWRREYDAWVPLARPWTLLAWSCLGAGLGLGGFWAYDSLGWGGFWGWDPVENSSLVPWLFASALLHGLVLQGARGSLKRCNLVLALVGYLLILYSTFLTRSGILGNFSVHSFVELGLMRYLVGFLAVFTLLGIGLLGWRWRDIEQRVAYRSVVSREFGLILSVALFIIVASIVAIGTSLPVITLLPLFRTQASVALDFYGPTVAPLGFLLLLTMAIGPLLGWQPTKYGTLWSLLKWPIRISAIALFGCVLLNIVYPVALLFVVAAVFASATNIAVIFRIWRSGPLRLGGYLAHVGVGLLFVGIVGTSVYKQTAALQLTQDTPQVVFGRQWTFRGMDIQRDDPLRRMAMQIEVTDPKTGRTWLAQAPYYVFEKSNQLVAHPAIQGGWWSDLYVAPSDYIPAPQTAPGVLQMLKERPQQIAGYTLTFQQFTLPDREAMLRGAAPPEVVAVVAVTAPDGTTVTITPRLRIVDNQTISEPLPLPGGATVVLQGVDPERQMATVQIKGVDLSKISPDALKARAFIEVSKEPGIKLVWGGFIVGILGGMVALLRRWHEARPHEERMRLPVPKRHRSEREANQRVLAQTGEETC